DIGMMLLKPGGKRRPQVVADRLEVAENRVGSIAFGGNALVVIGVGRSPLFARNGLRPGIFARRLIEVPMNTKRGFHIGFIPLKKIFYCHAYYTLSEVY